MKRWNVVDLLVGLLILGLASGGYTAVQVASGRWRRVPILHRLVPVDMLVTFVGVHPDTVNKMRAGDAEVDSQGHATARIMELLEIKPEELVVRFGDRDWVKRVPNPSSGLLDVSVRMRILAELRGDALFYKGRGLQSRMVASGTYLGFRTDRYEISGIVYDEGWVKFRVMSTNLPAEQAASLKAGSLETDLDGKPLARILKINAVKPEQLFQEFLAERQAASETKKAATAAKKKAVSDLDEAASASEKAAPASEDTLMPHRTDWPSFQVDMWVEVRCLFKNGLLLFKGIPVKESGSSVFFNLGDVKCAAIVHEIGALKTSTLTAEVPRT